MSEPVTEPVEEPAEGDQEPVEGDETQGEPEPEEEPEEPQEEPEARVEPSHDEIVLERRRTDAEKKWKRHETAIRAIYAEESEYLYACPLCPDQHRGLIDIRFAGQVPEELADAVTAYVRGAEQVHYQQAQNTRECTHCGGHGKVLSGSKVAGKDLIVCVSCKGFGFVPPPGSPDNGAVPEAPVLAVVGAEDGPLVTEDKDIWGSPKLLPDGQENPNYGRMVQYKDPRLP